MNAGRTALKPQNPNCAPSYLTEAERTAWRTEFTWVPAGQLAMHDHPVMLDLVRLLLEEREAYRVMIESNRGKSQSQHWRACVGAIRDSRRSLRLLPHARLEARHVALLARGRSRADDRAFTPTDGTPHDWRSLFPQRPGNEPVEG